MKTTSLLPLLLLAWLACPPPSARAWVYRNAVEFQGDGDFDGDGRADLVIGDRETGGYRIAYQLTAGVYTWAGPRASGIANATGMSVGRVLSLTRDALVFTSPDANRINILGAASPVAADLPQSLFITNVGPSMAGLIDIAGAGNTAHDDLYIPTQYDDGVSYTCRYTTLRNTGAATSFIAQGNLNGPEEYANKVVLKTTAAPRLAWYSRNYSPGWDLLFIDTFTNVAPSWDLYQWQTRSYGDPQYLVAPFSSTNIYSQLLSYWSGYATLSWNQVTESAAGFALAGFGSMTFTNTIDMIYALPGATDTKLCMLFNDGAAAGVYSFYGVTNPVLVKWFTPNPGEHFTGAGVLGANGFMAYSAPAGQRTSASFQQWNWNGSKYTSGARGNLPKLNSFSSSGNVMQFRYEPFVNSQPVLLRLNNAGDWSSTPVVSGGSLSVRAESFLSPTQGLGSPTTISLGAVHPLAGFDLPNQYTNVISLYSFQPAMGDKVSEVTVLPAPGTYNAAINLSFSAAVNTHLIFFRVGMTAMWQRYSNQPVRIFTNAIVQYYGQPAPGATKSAVKTASYTIKGDGSALDSNRDGLPDFVAISKGLDPNGALDSDGDGFSDLEELLHRSNPLDKTDYPTTNKWAAIKLHINGQATFDVRVEPNGYDGTTSTHRRLMPGEPVYTYDLNGGLLAMSPVATSPVWPSALLSNLVVTPDNRFFVEATPPHFSLYLSGGSTNLGRELVGLFPIPTTAPLFVTNTYAGGNITNAAEAWIVAASNAWWTLPRTVVNNKLTLGDTLCAMLFEKKVADILGARGNLWHTNITLFPHRVQDLFRTNPPMETLLALEEVKSPSLPAYKLLGLFNSMTNLALSGTNIYWDLYCVVRDIYAIDSRLNNDNPGVFVSPVDEVRHFLWTKNLDSNYLANTVVAHLIPDANRAVSNILRAVEPRPTTNVDLVVRSDSFSGPFRLLGAASGGRIFSLLNDSGLPYSFPGSFDLVPGALLRVAGYTDVTNTAGTNFCIQVTNVMLASIPLASDYDLDGNLLLDTWEKQFYGYTGQNPFADSDGDGFSNLQEMFDGTDPKDSLSHRTGSPALFAAPTLQAGLGGTNIFVFFAWPKAYQTRMTFGVRSAPAIGAGPFANIPVPAPTPAAGDWLYFVLPAQPDPTRFYYLSVSLAPLTP